MLQPNHPILVLQMRRQNRNKSIFVTPEFNCIGLTELLSPSIRYDEPHVTTEPSLLSSKCNLRSLSI